MAWDTEQLSALLRGLEPLPEKVVRLRYGLGCQRAHGVADIAHALGLSPNVIAGLLEVAEARLAAVGWTPRELRAAAGWQPRSGRARSCRGRVP